MKTTRKGFDPHLEKTLAQDSTGYVIGRGKLLQTPYESERDHLPDAQEQRDDDIARFLSRNSAPDAMVDLAE